MRRDEENQSSDFIAALDNAGVDEKYIAEKLKEWVETAYMVNPKTWDLIDDWKAKASMLNMLIKMRKGYVQTPQIVIANVLGGKAESIY